MFRVPIPKVTLRIVDKCKLNADVDNYSIQKRHAITQTPTTIRPPKQYISVPDRAQTTIQHHIQWCLPCQLLTSHILNRSIMQYLITHEHNVITHKYYFHYGLKHTILTDFKHHSKLYTILCSDVCN